MTSPMLGYLRRGPGRSTRPVDVAATVAFVAGAALVAWSAYIHFHLWGESQGYRQIPTIGPLFLAQSIGGLVLAVLIIAVRRVWVAAAGVGFAASTIAGFLLSVSLPKGLFNFKETWSAPFAHEALDVEIAIAVVLVLAAALSIASSASLKWAGPPPTGLESSGA